MVLCQTSIERAMNKKQLTFNHILDFLNQAIADLDESRQLSEIQIAVLHAAWEKLSYEEESSLSEYDEGSLKNAASVLYKELSKIFGKRISKHSFEEFIDLELEDRSSYIHQLDAEVYGSPPDIRFFKGRVNELLRLETMISTHKTICISGSAGIGKTSLAGKCFTRQRREGKYDCFVWYHAYSHDPEEDIQSLLFDVFKDENKCSLQDFLKLIKRSPSLIVLDGIDLWFDNNQSKAESYLKAIIESSHQSSLIFTSQVFPLFIKQLKLLGRSVDTMRIEGLTDEESLEILSQYDLAADVNANRFIRAFQGNPLHLHMGCMRIKESLVGTIDSLLEHVTSIAGYFLTDEFEKISGRLSEFDRTILNVIASESKEGVVLMDRLIQYTQNNLKLSHTQTMNAVDKLKNFSLISVKSNLGKVEIILPKAIIGYLQKTQIA